MNYSRRTLLGLGGGIAAAAVLTACGDNSGLDGESPGTESSGTESPTAGGGDQVALQQWYHEYGEAGVKEAVERYASEYPDATVQVKWTPGDYASILAAQLLTDDIPDVFEVEMGGSLDMIRSGQLEDLTDVISDSIDDFNQPVIRRFTFEDKIYGIPQTIDMQLLFYRKSLLEAAGVQPPQTFEELTAAAAAVRTDDIGGFFAGNDGGIGVLGTLLIWASGHEQLDEGRTEAAFLTEDFYQALTAFRDFYNSGDLLQSASADWFSPDAFVNEECAMQWGGLWSLPQIMEAHGEDVGVVPFPAIGANGRPAVPFGAYGACVAADGDNVDQAKDFVKWLWIDSEEHQVDFSNSYGTHIPAKDHLVPEASQVSEGPGADAASFVSEHGFANDIMWSGALGEAYGAALSNVVRNNADPATEFSGFGEQARTELEQLQG